jgi:hypothetical protein
VSGCVAKSGPADASTSQLLLRVARIERSSRTVCQAGGSPSIAEVVAAQAEVDRLLQSSPAIPDQRGAGISGFFKSIKASTDTLRRHEATLKEVHAAAERIEVATATLAAAVDVVAKALLDSKDTQADIYHTVRVNLYLARIRAALPTVLSGGDTSVTAADRMAREWALTRITLAGLEQGEPELGMTAVRDPALRAKAAELRRDAEALDADVATLAADSTTVFEACEAADTISLDAAGLMEALVTPVL